jgi:hypothetical protein
MGGAGQVAGAGRYPQPSGCGVPQTHTRRFFNNLGLGCWTHHDQFGCSSFWSEFRFVFGSCRSFFGEPCAQGPPRIPVPPGYVPPQGPPAPGYLPASQYRRHY